MRVVLLQGKQGEDPGGLAAALRQWVAYPEFSPWVVETRTVGGGTPTTAQRSDVLVFADAAVPHGPWLEEWLVNGVGAVVAVAGPCLEPYRGLAERYPLCWVPPQPGVECLGYAVLGIGASRRRQLTLRGQIEQLQQRLNDRIIIERAKGILVQRLGISEEEAYKRLRVLSRRQRRQIRDIAQSLLDAQSLLLADSNGLLAHPPEAEPLVPERPLPAPEASVGLPRPGPGMPARTEVK
jgi:hypothetical protein